MFSEEDSKYWQYLPVECGDSKIDIFLINNNLDPIKWFLFQMIIFTGESVWNSDLMLMKRKKELQKWQENAMMISKNI